jgi:3',5'-cyclic-AMP phosphodiesterase
MLILDRQIQSQKILWLTDTHVWNKPAFLNAILEEDPDFVFHTGDLTEGPMLEGFLDLLGRELNRPFYFVLGNHDFFLSDFTTTHTKVKALTVKYPNLIWMDEAGIVPLSSDTALIGARGWYDCLAGSQTLIPFSFDWFMIKDFRALPNMKARIEMFRDLAEQSADVLSARLKEAFETYETVYVLTHVPAWAEEFRSAHTYFPEFWASYNTNNSLGWAIENVMEKRADKRVVVLAGHIHSPSAQILGKHDNITHRVGRAGFRNLTNSERIII